MTKAAAEPEPAWVEIDGRIYGARPDDGGPLGGGRGYAGIVCKGDFTVRDLDELLDALSRARPGRTVFLPGDVVIDMSPRIYIEQAVLEIPAGVTLASDRGRDGSQGALIFSDALKTPALIRCKGPDVRITGLRLRGPDPRRRIAHYERSLGPNGKGRSYYYRFPVSDGIVSRFPRLRVDNCEISAFSHGGVYLQAGDGHRIDHCHIHHCQFQGLGYGVSLGPASATIEFNRFDVNRHSIAATGAPGSSYRALNNLVGETSLSHLFDMHGGRDRKDGTNIAGTRIEIRNNTFLAPQIPVLIRGVPQEKCDVTRNWFVRHASAADAVGAEENTYVFDNAFGPSPEKPQ